jgi:RNA polymerase sigma-70 factor (ECF subfamily)
VFLGAVKGIDSYRYQGQPLLAWLYRIARNVVGSHQRSLFKERTLTLSSVRGLPSRVFGRQGERVEPVAPASADPGVMGEQFDLRVALRKLPSAQREVLLLKFYVGMEARDISRMVGKEPAAVYSLQARGLQSLRRLLREPLEKTLPAATN